MEFEIKNKNVLTIKEYGNEVVMSIASTNDNKVIRLSKKDVDELLEKLTLLRDRM